MSLFSRLFLGLLVSSVLSCASSGAKEQLTQRKAWKPWTSKPIPKALPKIGKRSDIRREQTLPNGLKVTVIEQSARPIVSVRIFFPYGAASDPKGKAGATYFAYTLLGDYQEEDEDGRRLLSEKSRRYQVLEKGGRLDISIGVDASSIGIDGYAEDAQAYLNQLAEFVQKPVAGLRSFEGRKDSMIHALKDVDMSSDDHYYELLNQVVFGEKSPYGRPVYGSLKSLDVLTHEDVLSHQENILALKGAHLVIAGNVSSKAMLMAAMKQFGRGNPGKALKQKRFRAPRVERRRQVVVVPRERALMTSICVARPLSDIKGEGVELEIVAAVFGAGMQSRLMRSLREDAGLAYSAAAQIARRKHDRVLFACTRVPTKETQKGVRLFLKVLDSMKNVPITAEELQWSKATLKQRFRVRDDSIGGAMANVYDRFLYGQDSKDRSEQLKEVDAMRVQELASKVFEQTYFQMLLSGSTKHIRQAVIASQLGRIKTTRTGLRGEAKVHD